MNSWMISSGIRRAAMVEKLEQKEEEGRVKGGRSSRREGELELTLSSFRSSVSSSEPPRKVSSFEHLDAKEMKKRPRFNREGAG